MKESEVNKMCKMAAIPADDYVHWKVLTQYIAHNES